MQLKMTGRGSRHSVYQQGSDLVVEWYDYGDHAPYESATLLRFDAEGKARLSAAMGLKRVASPDELERAIARRFTSYFQVREFAEAHQVPFIRGVDFQP